MPAEKAEFLKGTLDMLILKVVAGGPHPRLRHLPAHSADLPRFLSGSPGLPLSRPAPPGRTRMARRRVERYGYWPRSQVLYPYPKGRKQLDTEMLHWEQLSDAVALILRTAE